jgi:RluA family pseudouridine synthase
MFLPARPIDKDFIIALHYSVIYEDDFFLVVDKPSPLPVHPVSRFAEMNLLTLVKNDFPNVESLHVVNRLDSETSGLVLIAKSSDIAGRLGKEFELRRVEKEYEAIVFGNLKEKQGCLEMPLGWCEGERHRYRVPDLEGEAARTEYKVIEERGAYSYLEIKPLTGRTHQIRAHLSFIGHAIVGDKIYVKPEIFTQYVQEGWQQSMRDTLKLSRLALHAARLSIIHPVEKKRMFFKSEMPKELTDFFEAEI